MSDSLLESLNRDGFVVVRSALSPAEVEELRAAAEDTTKHARAGRWPSVRTLPKQFPPWPAEGPNPAAGGIWGVQGLLHPDMPNRELYTRLYFSQSILGPTRELLRRDSDGPEVPLVMELCNLLVRPDRDFELRWHRDDISADATPAEELERLAAANGRPAASAQWNLALYDDASLIVVPGSHRRARTEIEQQADPYAPHLPDQLAVELRAGDAVFYDNNILHRGVYVASRDRMTIHGSAGHEAGARLRARNVLQHGGAAWIERCDFGVLDPETRAVAETMRRRLVKLGQDHTDVGYSLEG